MRARAAIGLDHAALARDDPLHFANLTGRNAVVFEAA
jgi:hypothetical protein